MSINFFRINSVEPVAKYLTDEINRRLKNGQKVLWLVPGGSAIAVATLASQGLLAGGRGVTVALTDERFGDPGHSDSNWRQLSRAGFRFGHINKMEVLTGKNVDATTKEYGDKLTSALKAADFSIGLFGIGADGHTAGIKPYSPAVSSPDLVSAYRAEDFTRVTVTPKFIAKLNEAVVYAVGGEKRPVVESLDSSIGLAKQPAQSLKLAGRLTVYNDYKGEPK